jgi:hypothetical protein
MRYYPVIGQTEQSQNRMLTDFEFVSIPLMTSIPQNPLEINRI